MERSGHREHPIETRAVAPVRRVLRDPVFAAALVVLGMLLVSWPFLRGREPSLSEACLFLFGTWAAVIVVLLAMARALRPEGRGRRGAGDG